MNSITPLPESLASQIPKNHVYVGMGDEFKTNDLNSRFAGWTASTANPHWQFSKYWAGVDRSFFYCVPIGSEIHKLNPHAGKLPSPKPSVASVSVVTVPSVTSPVVATKPKRKRKPKTEYFFAVIDGAPFWTYKYANRTGKLTYYSRGEVNSSQGQGAKTSVEYSRKYQKSCTRAAFLDMIKELGWKENGKKIGTPKPKSPSLKYQIEILNHEKKILEHKKKVFEDENRILKNENPTLKNENAALKEQNFMLRATKDGTDRAIVALKENIADLEKGKLKLREENEALKLMIIESQKRVMLFCDTMKQKLPAVYREFWDSVANLTGA